MYEDSANFLKDERFTKNITGSPNDGFLLNTLKKHFRLSRVLLDI